MGESGGGGDSDSDSGSSRGSGGGNDAGRDRRAKEEEGETGMFLRLTMVTRDGSTTVWSRGEDPRGCRPLAKIHPAPVRVAAYAPTRSVFPAATARGHARAAGGRPAVATAASMGDGQTPPPLHCSLGTIARLHQGHPHRRRGRHDLCWVLLTGASESVLCVLPYGLACPPLSAAAYHCHGLRSELPPRNRPRTVHTTVPPITAAFAGSIRPVCGGGGGGGSGVMVSVLECGGGAGPRRA